jgi:heme/copper-type cytochrome/quinol oxidase subunit 4
MGSFILARTLLDFTEQNIGSFMIILIVIAVIVVVGGLWLGYRSYKHNNQMNRYRK